MAKEGALLRTAELRGRDGADLSPATRGVIAGTRGSTGDIEPLSLALSLAVSLVTISARTTGAEVDKTSACGANANKLKAMA